eukprot:TRINITY_DN77712_c0_g1_i1.p1 TRINITY_DN77712_c0_g1~~TRINITY_DN77712_c0_g1_i1.p1  ORF type:complete len:172 (+),score=11.14 TRINITY_DN77712_c0_g1_i1:117-632(+)
MVGGHCQSIEGNNIAEDHISVEAMKREENKRAVKAEGQASGGYLSLDRGGEHLSVSPQTTLVPQPPRKRRPAGQKLFHRKFHSATIQATGMETTTQEDSVAPRTGTDSAVPLRRTPGRAASRFRARILSAQVQQHRCEALTDFEPIECTSVFMELHDPIWEMSDTESEESS